MQPRMLKTTAVLIGSIFLALVSTACFAKNISVIDMGAKGDGVTDNTLAFQQALDEAGKDGSIVDVPSGRYRINGNLRIPPGVTLQGTYRSAPLTRTANYSELTGSVLMAYAGRNKPDAAPFIELDHSATVAGLIITYPECKTTDVPPVPYPPCIAGKPGSENVSILDCSIVNPYEAIKLYRSARFLVRNVQGYPIKRGIFVDECYDIGKIENIHFWPFGLAYAPDDPYCKWINLNGVAFEFARTDWQYVTNTFCFGYGVGYKFSEYKEGACNGNFLGIGADSCQNAVVVEQSQGPGLLITNGEFVGRWSSMNANTLVVKSTNTGKVSLNNCSFWGPIDQCVVVDSPNGQFTASACNFLSYDVNGNNSPAIRLNAGNAILQGNTFGDGKLQVYIGKKVHSAVVMGNQAVEGINVENNIGKQAQILGNSVAVWQILSKNALMAYELEVGTIGDTQYLSNWSGRETSLEWKTKGTKRWSSVGAKLELPVLPGKEYTIELDTYIPKSAITNDSGIYLGKKRIAGITKEGLNILKGTIPAGKTDSVTLDIKCKIWVPKEVYPGSSDSRKLGISVKTVTLRAKGSKGPLYSANNGMLK